MLEALVAVVLLATLAAAFRPASPRGSDSWSARADGQLSVLLSSVERLTDAEAAVVTHPDAPDRRNVAVAAGQLHRRAASWRALGPPPVTSWRSSWAQALQDVLSACAAAESGAHRVAKADLDAAGETLLYLSRLLASRPPA